MPLARYVFSLSERLHIDVDEILAWSYDKLNRWIINDEVTYMINSVKKGNMTDADAVVIVAEEQARNDYWGIQKVKE